MACQSAVQQCFCRVPWTTRTILGPQESRLLERTSGISCVFQLLAVGADSILNVANSDLSIPSL